MLRYTAKVLQIAPPFYPILISTFLMKANRLLRNSLKSWFIQITFIKKVLDNSRYTVVSKQNAPVLVELLQTQVGNYGITRVSFLNNFSEKSKNFHPLKAGKELFVFSSIIWYLGRETNNLISKFICDIAACGGESKGKSFPVRTLTANI